MAISASDAVQVSRSLAGALGAAFTMDGVDFKIGCRVFHHVGGSPERGREGDIAVRAGTPLIK